MSFDEKIRENPVIWTLSVACVAFGAGFTAHAAIQNASGLETVTRGSYELTSTINSRYLPREEVETKYMPLSTVNAQFMARTQIEEQFISKADCLRQIEEVQKAIGMADLNSDAEVGKGAENAQRTPLLQMRSAVVAVEQDGFRFTLPSCQVGGARVNCDLTITNLERERRSIALYYDYDEQRRSYIADARGRQHWGRSVALGGLSADAEHHSSAPMQALEPEIPMAASAGFDADLRPGTVVSLIMVYRLQDRSLNKVTFRNILLGNR